MNRTHLFVIALVFVVVNSYLYAAHGIRVVADSERYFEYTNELKRGNFTDTHNFWYIGYALFILVCGSKPVVIVVAQYLLSVGAALALYKTAIILFKSEKAALLAALWFLTFVDISSWNSYILTESLYVSCICFSLYSCARYYEMHINGNARRNPLQLALTVLLILFTSFIKPTGIALVLAFAIVLLVSILRTVSPIIRYSSILIASIIFTLLINRMLSTFQVIDNYRLGEVIYGVTLYPNDPAVNSLIVLPPTDTALQSTMPLTQVIEFIAAHPWYWTKLFFAKIYSLLSHTRPFWSGLHNTFSLLFLLPCYFFCVWSLVRSTNKELKIFSIVYLAVHVLSVGITSNDWDGRFLVPMLPVIFLFSANEITHRVKVMYPR